MLKYVFLAINPNSAPQTLTHFFRFPRAHRDTNTHGHLHKQEVESTSRYDSMAYRAKCCVSDEEDNGKAKKSINYANERKSKQLSAHLPMKIESP